MPYNTRRVSLSLTSLGIQLPGSNASRAHRSPSNSNSTPKSEDNPPSKRQKRSHTLSSGASAVPTPTSLSPQQRSRNTSASDEDASTAAQAQSPRSKKSSTPKQTKQNTRATPPPSPEADSLPRVLDLNGVNDDVVVGVLEQLQNTGNRPHLIKELASILMYTLKPVQNSQNPTAIISSRLTNYLRRPWTALAPCPLAKEQVTQHPRRVYYFLTTTPRLPIPDTPMINTGHAAITNVSRIISPSISSGPEEEEVMASPEFPSEPIRCRDELSPSPEVDLSYNHGDVDGGDQTMTDSFFDPHDSNSYANHSFNTRQGLSPPLEHDEQEFTHTASAMHAKRQSERESQTWARLQQQAAQIERNIQPGTPASQSPPPDQTTSVEPFPRLATDAAASRRDSAHPQNGVDSKLDMDVQGFAPLICPGETADEAVARHRQEAATLFGPSPLSTSEQRMGLQFSSPIMRPFSPTMKPKLQIGKFNLEMHSTKGDASRMDVDQELSSAAGGSTWAMSDPWTELKSPEDVCLSELDEFFK